MEYSKDVACMGRVSHVINHGDKKWTNCKMNLWALLENKRVNLFFTPHI